MTYNPSHATTLPTVRKDSAQMPSAGRTAQACAAALLYRGEGITAAVALPQLHLPTMDRAAASAAAEAAHVVCHRSRCPLAVTTARTHGAGRQTLVLELARGKATLERCAQVHGWSFVAASCCAGGGIHPRILHVAVWNRTPLVLCHATPPPSNVCGQVPDPCGDSRAWMAPSCCCCCCCCFCRCWWL
jgi:hypothetical protein